MHQAPDEPRLDDAWVQYYGGAKLGGLKRLTSLDDDSPDDSNNSKTIAAPEIAITPESGSISETQNQTSLHSVKPESPSVNLHEAPTENPSQNTVAPIKDFYRQEKSRTADAQPAPRPVETETGRAPTVGQVDESKGVSFYKLHVDSPQVPANMDSTAPSFESWSKRWAPWLKRGGSIKVCEAFFLMTHAQGKAECFTSNSEIMKWTELSRAQCIRNIHYLIEMGFLDELNEVNNRDAKGTYYRFNLIPQALAGQ
jgi:hypothetical protein